MRKCEILRNGNSTESDAPTNADDFPHFPCSVWKSIFHLDNFDIRKRHGKEAALHSGADLSLIRNNTNQTELESLKLLQSVLSFHSVLKLGKIRS